MIAFHHSFSNNETDTVHNPEWTQSRMVTIPNGTIPNGHHPECTIPNGYRPEWTPSRMSIYDYIVTLVFYSYCWVRSLLRRRGFKQKINSLIKFKSSVEQY